jgi:hypothetical protein
MQPVFAAQGQRAHRPFAPVMPRPGLCRVTEFSPLAGRFLNN